MNRITSKPKLFSAILSIILLLNGCFAPLSDAPTTDVEKSSDTLSIELGGTQKNPEEQSEEQPMGKYVETNCTPQIDGAFKPTSLRKSDGNLILSLYDGENRQATAFTWKNGTWEKAKTHSIQTFIDSLPAETAIRHVWHAGNDIWWIETQSDDLPALYRVAEHDVRIVDLSEIFSLVVPGDPLYIADFAVADGCAICCFVTTSGRCSVLAVDAQTCDLLYTITPPVAEHSLAIVNDTLYLRNRLSGTVDAYALHSGEKLLSHIAVPQIQEASAYTVTNDGGIVYLTMNGIFQCNLDSTVNQIMVEDKGFVYAVPQTNHYHLSCLDQSSYMVACVQDDALCVVTITLDASLPTQAAHSLSVWALEDSDIIRSAAAIFSKQYPDYDVQLTFGHDVTSQSLSDEDIIKNLNTRLLAGEAPDVLFLDGLPIHSLIEKGILSPLDNIVQQENFYKNILSAYTVDGTPYAYPTVFHIPLFVNCSNELDTTDFTSLDAFADLYANRDKIFNTSYADIFDSFYIAYSAEMFPAEKRIDEKKLHDFLQSTKAMIDGQGITAERNQYLMASGDGQSVTQTEYAMSLYHMAEGNTPCGTGLVNSCADGLKLFWAWPSVDIIPLPGNGFEAKEIVSIPINAAEPELAKAFVRIMLTEPAIQLNGVRQGFSVQKDVERFHIAEMISQSDTAYASDPLQFDWDTLIGQLTAPSLGSATVYNATHEAAFLYYHGSCDLDSAISRIQQALYLYFAEQG